MIAIPKTFIRKLEQFEKKLVEKGIRKAGPIIAVSGRSGSGKSEAVRLILKALPKMRRVYVGGLFREKAREKGMSIEEFSRTRTEGFDCHADEWLLRESIKGNAVSDGHISAWVVGNWADVRILVTCPMEMRARRIARRENVSEKDAKRMIAERDSANARHYSDAYGIDMDDNSVYTHVIDNSGTLRDLKKKVNGALCSLR